MGTPRRPACPLQGSAGVFARVVLVGLLALVWGCAHHEVGRPPSGPEIADMNKAGGGPAGMNLLYVSPDPCRTEGCTVETVRPVSGGAPSKIRQIVSADERQLTVVSESGEVWHLDMSTVAGVTAPSRTFVRGTLIGGGVGLAVGALVALGEIAFSGSWPDAQVDASPGHPVSAGTIVGTMVGFTLVGAIIGALIDHHSPGLETFDFGGGHWLDPSSLRR
jgi:hypothetical protein